MASPDYSVSWKDIKEGVLLCVICENKLKDPKQLQCLHRVCRACLNAKIDRQEGSTIWCPKCWLQIRIPRNGIDGFDVDFLGESVSKLNEIHQNFMKKRRQERCCVCDRNSLQLYCFKCKGYLCDRCNKRHNQNVAAFDGHMSALLALGDFSSKDGNVQKIFGHIAPKCKNHPTITASKCCDNCNNETVCDQCINESHSRHTIRQISDTVKRMEENFNTLLPAIEKGVANIKRELDNIDDTKEKVASKIKTSSENLLISYNHGLEEIKKRENFVEDRYEDRKLSLKNDLDVEIDTLKKSMEEEMKQVAEKYEKLKSEKKEKAATTERKLETSLKKEKQKIEEIRQTMKTNYATLVNDLNTKGTCKQADLSEMMGHFSQIVLRYENFTETLSRVRATGSDWTAMKEIPVIRSAAEDLTQSIVNKSFPTLDSLAKLPPYKLEEINLECNESFWEEDEDP